MNFKVCPSCEHEWESRKDFLDDRSISLLGYQVNFGDLEAGIFMFFHDKEECQTSLAIEAGRFTDMHDGPMFKQRLAGTDQCPGRCLHESDLDPCKEHCECAYVRDVLQTIKEWPRAS